MGNGRDRVSEGIDVSHSSTSLFRCKSDGLRINIHPKCFACGVLFGEGHMEDTYILFRDKKLCSYCSGKLDRVGYLDVDGKRYFKNGKVSMRVFYSAKKNNKKKLVKSNLTF